MARIGVMDRIVSLPLLIGQPQIHGVRVAAGDVGANANRTRNAPSSASSSSLSRALVLRTYSRFVAGSTCECLQVYQLHYRLCTRYLQGLVDLVHRLRAAMVNLTLSLRSLEGFAGIWHLKCYFCAPLTTATRRLLESPTKSLSLIFINTSMTVGGFEKMHK